MNKELLHWVLIIALTTIGFFLLTGCANMQMAENNKRDVEYRKQVIESVKNKPVREKVTEGKIEQREMLVCDEYHSTIKKETYQAVYGITLEDKCRYETETFIIQPIAMPKEWFEQWDQSNNETELEQVKSVPVCELCQDPFDY